MASWGSLFGRVGSFVIWIIGAAALLAGIIEQWRGLSWRGNNRQLHRPFGYAWDWMDYYHAVLWGILRVIAPTIPDGQSVPFGWMIWSISWALMIWGITAFGQKLKAQGQN